LFEPRGDDLTPDLVARASSITRAEYDVRVLVATL
jgi:hypothetical protein